jgi:ABC-2 type transport system permease protein
MTLPPASLAWLLRHELRLAWRNAGVRYLKTLLVLGGLGWIGYHALVWLQLHYLLDWPGAPSLPPSMFVLSGAVLWFVFVLMVSQAMTRSVSVFFERGDLDLLLASPLVPRHVFVARALGVAISCVGVYAVALVPFAHVGVLIGRPGLLAIYPALAALALLATAIGVTTTIALVRAVGARRARVAAQIVGALVGGLLFLALQSTNLLPRAQGAAWSALLRNATAKGGALEPQSLVWLALDAMLGEPVALLVLIALGGGTFALVVTALARRFLDVTRDASFAPARRARDPAALRFRGALWRVVLTKEWRLLRRDPQLIAQSLLQLLYLLPLVAIWIKDVGPASQLLLPAMLVGAALLASGLAWVTVVAEDAPELVATAPVSLRLLRWLKLAAGVLPVWLLMAPVALFVAFTQPLAALEFTLCIVGATIAAGVIQLSLGRPGKRGDLRRRGRGNLVASAFELLSATTWSALNWVLLAEPDFGAFVLLPALAIPAAAWWLGRDRRGADVFA